MDRPSPLVIGHRGAPGYRPEHTRSSYELALGCGVDAVEPDVVPTRDGVLVVRHENEIGSTTDVADRPRFAGRRTTKTVDGVTQTGWFTEDFTWDELATLRARERLPRIRPDSARFDDTEPILRLRDLLDLVAAHGRARGREVGVVLEIKHATTFAALGFDMAALVAEELRDAGWAGGAHPLYIESFEQTVLTDLQRRGIPAAYVYLLEADGAPFDLVAGAASVGGDGPTAPRSYADQLTDTGLDRLAQEVDGISLDKRIVLAPDGRGRTAGPSAVVARARNRGLTVFAWTCRPENTFLLRQFRRSGGARAFGDFAGEWHVLRAAGLDGVFVDHPDLGTAFFRSEDTSVPDPSPTVSA